MVTANPADAQRLLDEIPWFALHPCACACCPTGNPALRPFFAPTTTWFRNAWPPFCGKPAGRAGRSLPVPAATAVYRLPRRRSGRLYLRLPAGRDRLDAENFAARSPLAATATSPRWSRRLILIRGGLIDLFPMGSVHPTASISSTTRSKASRPSTPTASAPCIPVPEIRLRRPGISPRRRRAHHFRQRLRKPSRVTPPNQESTRIFPAASPAPASSITCRSFSPKLPALFGTIAGTRWSSPWATRRQPSPSGATSLALRFCSQGDRARPAAPGAVPHRRSVFRRRPFPTAAFSFSLRLAAIWLALPGGRRRPSQRRAAGAFAHFVVAEFSAASCLRRNGGETLAAPFPADHAWPPGTAADLTGLLGREACLWHRPRRAVFPFLARLRHRKRLFAGAPAANRRTAQKKAGFDNWLKDLTELKVATRW